MDEVIDIKKAARQLLEIETFFAGDFTLRSPELLCEPIAGASGQSAGDLDAACADAAVQLKAVAAEVVGCSLCQTLAETRTKVVPGEGDPCARLVFVGEAPGADEDAQGRPFVGRAGQLLTKIIAAMGLERQDVFICNILKCRPPGNRDPKPEERENCWPFLRRQLEAIQPEIIVALGAHAAKVLLDVDKPIGQLRGRFHEYYFSPEMPPVMLMPTYHPSYLQRNYSPDTRRHVWDDMQKVMAELGLEIPKTGTK
jgi:DNA polymerase